MHVTNNLSFPTRFFPRTLCREKLEFLAKFLRSPRTVGSVTPSSRFLTNKMMEPIAWDQVRTMAELGAGTGVFTRAIAERIHPDTTMVVYEQDPEMRARLEAAFPAFHHRADALELANSVRELGLPGLDCIVSGLPLTVLPRDLREEIMDEVVGVLKPGGLFVQFQYSLHMRGQLLRRFSRMRTTLVPLNLPLAFVHVCQK